MATSTTGQVALVPTPAYAHFVHFYIQEFRKLNPNREMTMKELEDSCLSGWKGMTEKHKRVFEHLEANDRKRYNRKMAAYPYKYDVGVPQKPKEEEKKKKKKKDPDMPKRGLCAFIYFCNEKRAGIRQSNPKWTFGELSTELGRLWRQMTYQQQYRYHQLSLQDNLRYRSEMEQYYTAKSQGQLEHQGAPAATGAGSTSTQNGVGGGQTVGENNFHV